MSPKKGKRILIAGGGYAEIPLIHAAQKLGFFVISSGNDPKGMGHKFADQVCLEDYSNKHAMLKLASSLDIDGICPGCNDFSAISCAFVAEQLGLPGYDSYHTSVTLHHKDKYRQFALDAGIASPTAKGFDNQATAELKKNSWTYPVMVKPVDLTGGKGITKVNDPIEYCLAIAKAFKTSKAKRVIVEEFLDGSRHGFCTLIRDKKVIFHFNDNEHYHLNPYLVSGASAPGKLATSIIKNLINQTEKIADRLNLKDGLIHIQFILCKNEPVIIEICRRPPGDLYPRLVTLSSGVDLPMQIINSFDENTNLDVSGYSKPKYYSRHCSMADRNGIIKTIYIDEEISPFIEERVDLWSPGDEITAYLTQKSSIFFLHYPDKETFDRYAEKISDHIKTVVA